MSGGKQLAVGLLGPLSVTVGGREVLISGARRRDVLIRLQNNIFAGRDARLLLIDGGHWLLVLVLMGAIIGGMGT